METISQISTYHDRSGVSKTPFRLANLHGYPGSLRNSTGLVTVGFQWAASGYQRFGESSDSNGQAPLDFDGLLMIISAVRRAKRKARRTKYNVNSKTRTRDRVTVKNLDLQTRTILSLIQVGYHADAETKNAFNIQRRLLPPAQHPLTLLSIFHFTIHS
jgi:hypothetical protein